MCRSILPVLTILTLTLATEAKGQSEQPPGDATTTRLEQLVKVRRAQLGPEHPDTLQALSELADAYAQAGGADKALVLHRELFELRRETLGPEHADTVMAMEMLARDYQALGQFDQAEGLWREVVRLSHVDMGPENPRLLPRLRGLAGVIGAQGRPADAEKLFREVLEIQKRVLGPEHPDTLVTLPELANAILQQGRYAEAEKLFGDVLEIRRRVLGPEHPETLQSMSDLAGLHVVGGRYVEAEQLWSALLAIQRRMSPQDVAVPEDKKRLLAMSGLYQPRALPRDDQALADVLGGLGLTLTRLGRSSEAEPLLRECLAIREKKSPDSWQPYLSKSLLGECLSAQGKLQDAEPLLIDGYQGLKARARTMAAPDRKRLLSDALHRLITHYESASRLEEVAHWQAELEQLQSAEAAK